MKFLMLLLMGYPWPLAPQNQIHTVVGTFGEYRSTLDAPHFHNGTDIADPEGTPVYAVESGSVTWMEREGFNCGLRVGRFAYIHVIPRSDINLGDYINQGEIVGYLNYGNHVHFKDGGGASGRATRNALLPVDGLEPFEDPYHTNVLGVWFFTDNVGHEISGNALYGLVDIVARAIDTTSVNTPGGQNNGIFSIGYAVLTEDTSQFVVPPHTPFVFDTLPPSSALPYTYYQEWSNTSTYYYIVTNEFYGNGYLDTRQLEPGNYILAIFTGDTRNVPDTFYFPITIVPSDTTPPEEPHLRYFVINDEGYPELSWSPVQDTDLAGYQIFLRLNRSRWTQWETAQAGDSVYTFSDPPINNMAFSIKVTAFDNFCPPNVSDTSEVFVLRQVNGRQSLLMVNDGVLGSDASFFFRFAMDAPYLQLESASRGFERENYHAIWLAHGSAEWSPASAIDLASYMNNGVLVISGSSVAAGMADDSTGHELLQMLGIDSVGTPYSAAVLRGVPGTPFCQDTFAYSGLVTPLHVATGTPLLMDGNGNVVATMSGNDVLLSFDISALSDEDLATLIDGLNALIDLQGIEESANSSTEQLQLKPTSDGLMFYSTGDQPVQLTVFDVSGRQLLSKRLNVTSGWNHIRLNIAGNGVRIVQLKTANRVLTLKLLDLQ